MDREFTPEDVDKLAGLIACSFADVPHPQREAHFAARTEASRDRYREAARLALEFCGQRAPDGP